MNQEDGLTAVEIKHTLDGRRLTFPCAVCCLQPPSRAVLYYVSEQGWTHHTPEIRVPPGSLTFAYYWSDRPYNVYHWVHPDGTTVGFYFNIAGKTVIHPGTVEWEDLAVDYWLDPDGRGVFLDEADLPSDLAPSVVEAIQAVKADLTANAPTVARDLERATSRWLHSTRRGS
ncbi:MAG TPA: DUF402 domain-containing protein [Chloroflexota bacterium]|nr:DUF402 domain-containing protein [Chloroflexota bacterium]